MAHHTENSSELKNDIIQSLLKKISVLQQQHDAMYEGSPDLFRTVNIKGIIINCNESYARTLGYSKNEIIGTPIFDHVAESSLDALQESFESWKNESHVHNREIWMKRKDGTTFPTLLSATSIYDEKGNLIGSNTAIRDMSELYSAKKKTEEQKIKRLSAIGEVSARIAHDLRNPLVVIKNAVQLMQLKNSFSDEKSREYFAKIDRAILRMTHMVDEVLDYVSPKPLNLDATSILETLVMAKEKLQISENVIINLPQNDVVLVHDQEKLEIVFINLMTNALQAMERKGGKIDVRIVETASEVRIEFEDTGKGMPPDVLEKIFEPMFTTKQTGTGLGLASCKSIVEKHNGRIEVQSVVDRGSVFIIRLPKSISHNLVKQN